MNRLGWCLALGVAWMGCQGEPALDPIADPSITPAPQVRDTRPRAPFRIEDLQRAPIRIPALSKAPTWPRLADGIGDLLAADGQVLDPDTIRQVAGFRGLRVAGDRVQVVIHLDQPADVLRGETWEIEGVQVLVDAASAHQVQGWIRLGDLARLSTARGVKAITAPRLPERTVVSEGVAHVKATTLHALGIRGQGQKVGIVDVGFSGYQSLLGSELPASVTTRSFFGAAPGDITGGGEVHGVAVAEVVHDMVPDAALYLVNFDSEVTFRSAVDWLISQGVHVITTSTGTYQWEDVDGRGPAARKASSARDAGILFTAAAGNDGNAHYRGTFTPSSVPEYHRFYAQGGNILILADDGTDIYYIPQDAPIIVGLVWDDWGQNDGTPTSTVDYDLYLVYYDETNSVWSLVTSSTDTQNGSAYPRESIGVYAPLQAVYGVVVAKKSAAAANRPFDLHVLNIFGDDLPLIEPALRTAAQSVVSPCVGERVLCIGATYLSDELAAYSSQGPSHPRPDGTTLPKPEFTAPTSVSTVTYPKNASTPDGFGGTSAATPHAAGVATLFRQLAGGDPDLAETQMRLAAIDLGPTGRDDAYGWGRVRAVPCWTELCDDGLFCTTDRCDEVQGCLHAAGPAGCLIGGTCYSPGQPNPSNPCQACNPANPTTWSPVEDNTPCQDDGLSCTADVCSVGTCTHYVSTGCLINGICRAPGEDNPQNPCQWCAPANRTQWTDKPVGSPCEDGLFCTTGETCAQGALCQGGSLRDCSAVADACNGASCNEGLRACVKVPGEDGAPCPDDGDACTLDRCSGGTCSHPALPNDCGGRVCGRSPNGCHDCGTCPEGFGCTADGQCSDLCANVQCPECQACSAGVCVAANDGNACSSDGNPCTLDACQAGACTHGPVPGDPPCDDGNLCTRQDRCRAGSCVGEDPVTCVAPDACHLAGTCDPGTGRCSQPAVDDGTPCLSDQNECTLDQCRSGACEHLPVDDQTPCASDGLSCTADVCLQGVCGHPVSSGCLIEGTCHATNAQNPENPCQSCQPGKTAVAWSSKEDGTRCEDGLYCTVSDQCQAGVCTGGSPKDCSGLDEECRVGTCSEANRACIAEKRPDGTACGDSYSCVAGLLVRPDSCLDGVCRDGGTEDCSPYAGCTQERTCRSTCDDGRDCIAGYRCVSSACVANRAPVADAGPDQDVPEGTEVHLDGTASGDPDGDPLTYAWVQVAGPEVTLDDPHAVSPTFQAPLVDEDTVVVFQLVVFDGLVNSLPDAVSLSVRDQPVAPDSGEDAELPEGEDVGTPEGEDAAGDAIIEDLPGGDTGRPDGPGEDVAGTDTAGGDLPGGDAALPDSGADARDPGDGAESDQGMVPLDLVALDAAGDAGSGGKGGGCSSRASRTTLPVWLLPLALWGVGRVRRTRKT
ncbi:MAG TPA: S8 family serine peptidase [Myxococcota bacterium]|mgnify:CR=1 FL=1|nr:S8 family serine peptidase [Myxococcota bacterium]HQK49735.1 S8 family serine peptidase [Myxococcota bacterium]